MKRHARTAAAFSFFLFAALFCPAGCFAEDLLSLAINGNELFKSAGGLNPVMQVFILFTLLNFVPTILVMMTSFTRIVIVLSFIRRALSTQTTPPNQILVGIALFVTFFVMAPVFKQMNDQALTPYLNHKITQQEAFKNAVSPLKDFMLRQTRDKDIAVMYKVIKQEPPAQKTQTPMYILIPAFMITELQISFIIGFLLFLPFLVIDLVVASALLSMGMMMLPPVMVSIPFKILLFVMIDGWGLLITSLCRGFR